MLGAGEKNETKITSPPPIAEECDLAMPGENPIKLWRK